MTYITEKQTVAALQRMYAFHEDLETIFSMHKLPFKTNLGRRNVILSQAQEDFFAQELAKTYEGVVCDGATGRPDIVIGELNKEIECKLTSRGVSGQIQFQCDENTLATKGSLDFLYVVGGTDFREFAVLHFIDLDSSDFHPSANGSKGRAKMKKSSAMQKCNVVWGSVDNLKTETLNKIRLEILDEKVRHVRKLSELKDRYDKLTQKAVKAKENIERMSKNEQTRYSQKIKKMEIRLGKWHKSSASYRINLEKIPVFTI